MDTDGTPLVGSQKSTLDARLRGAGFEDFRAKEDESAKSQRAKTPKGKPLPKAKKTTLRQRFKAGEFVKTPEKLTLKKRIQLGEFDEPTAKRRAVKARATEKRKASSKEEGVKAKVPSKKSDKIKFDERLARAGFNDSGEPVAKLREKEVQEAKSKDTEEKDTEEQDKESSSKSAKNTKFDERLARAGFATEAREDKPPAEQAAQARKARDPTRAALTVSLDDETWPSRYDAYDTFMRKVGAILTPSNYPQLEQERATKMNRCEESKEKKLDAHQWFPSLYLGATTSNYHGLLAYWSVGAGKTAAAWAFLSMFKERERWSLLWVTKNTLVAELWKDAWAFGDESREAIARRVTVMTYKQLNGYLKDEPSKRWLPQLERNGLMRTASRLYRTAIVIDEAHLLYENESLDPQARLSESSLRLLERHYRQAYSELARKDQPKTLLLTGTPFVRDPTTVSRLLNLLVDKQSARLPTETEALERAVSGGDFKRLVQGLVSCYETRMDKTRYAQVLVKPYELAAAGALVEKKLKQVPACKNSKDAYAQAMCYLTVAAWSGKGAPQFLPPELNVLKPEYDRAEAKQAFFAPTKTTRARKSKPTDAECEESCAPGCTLAQMKKSSRFKQAKTIKQGGVLSKPKASYRAADIAQLCQELGLERGEANAVEGASFAAPKLPLLWKNIQALDASSDRAYKHLIFSSVGRGLGAPLIASALSAQGIPRVIAKPDPQRRGGFYLETPEGKRLAEIGPSAMAPKIFPENAVPNAYVLMTEQLAKEQFGTAIDSVQGKRQLKRLVFGTFNARPDNVRGKLIRFLVLDSKFKEGVDVFDVRYIHLFEPQLTPADTTQAVGRGVRRCGQSGLKFNQGWRVALYTYGALRSDARDAYGVETEGDEIVGEQAQELLQKSREVQFAEELLEALREYAVSGVLYECRQFALKKPARPYVAARAPEDTRKLVEELEAAEKELERELGVEGRDASDDERKTKTKELLRGIESLEAEVAAEDEMLARGRCVEEIKQLEALYADSARWSYGEMRQSIAEVEALVDKARKSCTSERERAQLLDQAQYLELLRFPLRLPLNQETVSSFANLVRGCTGEAPERLLGQGASGLAFGLANGRVARVELLSNEQAKADLERAMSAHKRAAELGVAPQVHAVRTCSIQGRTQQVSVVVMDEWSQSLTQALRGGDKELACRLLEKVYNKILTLHQNGIGHGDLHPHNIMVNAAMNDVALIDFEHTFPLAEPEQWIDGWKNLGFNTRAYFANARDIWQEVVKPLQGNVSDEMIRANPAIVDLYFLNQISPLC